MATTEGRTWWSPIIITVVGVALLWTGWWQILPAWLLNVASFILGCLLILIILIQRGKGGGLAGAFGGVGGSSPFGSRAGDQFTRFTITLATLWIWVILVEVRVIQGTSMPAAQQGQQASKQDE